MSVALLFSFGDLLVQFRDAVADSRVSFFFASASSIFFCPINAPISFGHSIALGFEAARLP